MTLHLARASALENAGLCLHPIYGFTYLPGTGLKGLARAYAETVWLAAKPPERQNEAWKTIERVFGWAPGSDQVAPGKAKPWKPGDPGLDHAEDDAANAGVIVFHDAWPEKWPSLLVDIVNNHHSTYYQSQEDSPRVTGILRYPSTSWRSMPGRRSLSGSASDDGPRTKTMSRSRWPGSGSMAH